MLNNKAQKKEDDFNTKEISSALDYLWNVKISKRSTGKSPKDSLKL